MAVKSGNEARRDYDAWHAALPVDTSADAPWHTLVQRHIGPVLQGARVLEIGCGRGGFAAWLATSGAAQVVAADFSPTAVEKARQHTKELANVDTKVWDIQNIPCDNQSFDLVVSCETVEHLPDPAAAVSELARVLTPGGQLFLTTPNYLGPLGLLRGYRRLVGRPYQEEGQPINRFTTLPRTIYWIRRAGMEIATVDGTGHYLPVKGRTAGPLEIRVPETLEPKLRWLAAHSLVAARRPL